MRIYFVGMHNKTGKTGTLPPLSNSTKSGKLIDRIIATLPPATYVKTNLYNVDYYPNTYTEKGQLAMDFVLNHPEIEETDIMVLLGAEVHQNFPSKNVNTKNIVKIAHPSSQRSHAQMRDYVAKAAVLIQRFLKPGKYPAKKQMEMIGKIVSRKERGELLNLKLPDKYNEIKELAELCDKNIYDNIPTTPQQLYAKGAFDMFEKLHQAMHGNLLKLTFKK